MVLRNVYCYVVGFRMITFHFLLFLYFQCNLYRFTDSRLLLFPHLCILFGSRVNPTGVLTSNHLFSWRRESEVSAKPLYLPLRSGPVAHCTLIIMPKAILNYLPFQNSMWWCITGGVWLDSEGCLRWNCENPHLCPLQMTAVSDALSITDTYWSCDTYPGLENLDVDRDFLRKSDGYGQQTDTQKIYTDIKQHNSAVL